MNGVKNDRLIVVKNLFIRNKIGYGDGFGSRSSNVNKFAKVTFLAGQDSFSGLGW